LLFVPFSPPHRSPRQELRKEQLSKREEKDYHDSSSEGEEEVSESAKELTKQLEKMSRSKVGSPSGPLHLMMVGGTLCALSTFFSNATPMSLLLVSPLGRDLLRLLELSVAKCTDSLEGLVVISLSLMVVLE
jgi:hypothetical protein